MEPKNQPIERENHLPNLHFGFHVNFPGCNPNWFPSAHGHGTWSNGLETWKGGEGFFGDGKLLPPLLTGILLLGWWVYPLLCGNNGSWSTLAHIQQITRVNGQSCCLSFTVLPPVFEVQHIRGKFQNPCCTAGTKEHQHPTFMLYSTLPNVISQVSFVIHPTSD